ncbi:MAG: hypothetical protein ACLVJB_08990 [Christensenellales bacterium]
MTTATLAGLVLIGGFVLLLLLRVPISFAMLLSTLGSAMVTHELPCWFARWWTARTTFRCSRFRFLS